MDPKNGKTNHTFHNLIDFIIFIWNQLCDIFITAYMLFLTFKIVIFLFYAFLLKNLRVNYYSISIIRFQGGSVSRITQFTFMLNKWLIAYDTYQQNWHLKLYFCILSFKCLGDRTYQVSLCERTFVINSSNSSQLFFFSLLFLKVIIELRR